LWKRVLRFFKKLKIELPYIPAIALLGIYARDAGVLFQRGTCTPMFTAALLTIAKVWKETKCPLMDERIKKTWCVYTTEYFSAIKKNEILPFATTWMEREGIMLSK
ncbi:LORF2 protein, partial [Crocuta crocuta]